MLCCGIKVKTNHAKDTLHDTGMEAMEALHSSQALRSIGAAKESAATRESIMPGMSEKEEEAAEDPTHEDSPGNMDDMDFDAFAPVGGLFAPSTSAAQRASLAAPSVQKPVSHNQGFGAALELHVAPHPVPETEGPPSRRSRKDSKAAEQIIAKAQDCLDKMKFTHAPEKLWANPPRSRTGSRSVFTCPVW